MDVQRRDISRTVGDTELKLLPSANRKSYMPYRLAQQRDIECLKSTLFASRAISAVAEFLVAYGLV